MTETALIEPSFADALRAIEQSTDLAPQKRAQWASALRQIAKALDKPMETLPARWTAVTFSIERLHHAVVGANSKTLANQKSNVKAALRWFADEAAVPSRGAPLTPAWQALRDKLPDDRQRAKLSGLMRYCSAKGIAPEAVDEPVLDQFMRYRGETTALATNAAARRAIARAWNAAPETIEGWPAQRLLEPPITAARGPAWEEFPEGLRNDITAHLDRMTAKKRSLNGKRRRPCKASTVRTRRAELLAAARTAVRLGIPIESLTSLCALLHPDVSSRVIEAYWEEDGTEPRVYTIDLGWKVLSIARELGTFTEEELDRLNEVRETLELWRRGGMTEKNLTLVRQVLSEGVWARVCGLPGMLMKQARLLREQAQVKAAVTAQLAVGIGILLFAPVRLANLSGIKLDENLIKPGGPQSPYRLVFPHYDVKNRVDLEYPLDDELTSLIDEYVYDYRPALLRGSNESWLFPGEAGGHKSGSTFSEQIMDRVESATGLRLTAHQFRHAAAAIWLKHHPGDYETVRRVLGHRNIQTTIRFYCGLETIQANAMFGDMIRGLMRPELTGA
ncbi:MAG: site-specific integrase [Rhodoplanes sp.]|uniref:site-specific integrase n=1 Tax=Rhodoplanes sp. TaxID=1968906 RepID=UPI0017EEC22A|nr:site-specific integrase [Rhodoplanes sp.]NVO13605.1 site-specific integrase [Rhodoplanes sp.]